MGKVYAQLKLLPLFISQIRSLDWLWLRTAANTMTWLAFKRVVLEQKQAVPEKTTQFQTAQAEKKI